MHNAQSPGKPCCVVAARIINEDDIIDDVKGDFAVGLLQGFLGVIGRQDDDDFFVMDHNGLDDVIPWTF
jgi:hypothetical protein